MAATITPAVGRADRIIHTAAKEGNVDRIREQITLGESFRAVDSEGRVPLHIAVIHSQVEAVRLLLELGEAWIPLTEDELNSPLHLVALTGNCEIARLIFKHYPIEELLPLRNLALKTAFELATTNSNADIGAYFIKKSKLAIFIDENMRAMRDLGSSSSFTSFQFKEEPLNPIIFYDLSEVTQSEGLLHSSLIGAFKNQNLPEQISYLTGLALFSLNRRDYWRATLLLNSAYSAAQHPSISSRCRQQLFSLMQQIEFSSIDGHLTSSSTLQSRIQEYRIRLHKIRTKILDLDSSNLISIRRFKEGSPGEKIRGGLEFFANLSHWTGDQGANNPIHRFIANIMPVDDHLIVEMLLKKLNRAYKKLLSDLLFDCISLLGTPPTRFAMVGLGSIGRGEACPYSDVEFLFLIEADAEENRSYFRSVARLMAIKIAHLGETSFKIIRIIKEDGEIEERSLTPSGFSVDIGGLSPLGKEGIYELIGTPQELARFQTEEWLQAHDAEIILVNALTNHCWIAGEESLAVLYQKEVDTLLNSRPGRLAWLPIHYRLRESRALTMMQAAVEDFEPQLNQNKVSLRGFNVKKELYRLPQMIVNSLSLYFGVQTKNTIERIKELGKKKIISTEGCDRLLSVIRTALHLRIKTHFFYRSDYEVIYFSKGAEESAGLYLASLTTQQEILSIYQTLVPLYEVALDFLNSNKKAFRKSPLYNKEVGMFHRDHQISLDFQKTQQFFKSIQESLALNPNHPEANLKSGIAQLQHGDPDTAIANFERTLEILRRQHGEKPDPQLALTLLLTGQSYLKKGEFVRSTELICAGCLMMKRLKPKEELVDLKMIAAIYLTCSERIPSLRPELNQSVSILLNSVKSEDPDSLDFSYAPLFAALGMNYERSQNFEEACAHYRTALTVYQQHYGGEAQPEIAALLKQLGILYLRMGNFSEAIQNCMASLSMKKHLPEIESPLEEVKMLILLASSCLASRQLERAIELYQSALSAYKAAFGETEAPEVIVALLGIGSAYSQLDQLDQGLDYMSRGLLMKFRIERDKMDLNLGLQMKRLALCFEEANDFSRAIDLAQSALSIYKEAYPDEPNREIGNLYITLGDCYSKLEESSQAIESYATAISILGEIEKEKPSAIAANTMHKLGLLYQSAGETERANQLISQSASIHSKAILQSACQHQ